MTATAPIRYHLHPQAAHRKVAGEIFVVTGDRAFHRLHAATAVELFDALSQAKAGASVEELTRLLVQQYAVSEPQAREDVTAFLATLLERRLAEIDAAHVADGPEFTTEMTQTDAADHRKKVPQ